jgi:cation diffusion facilitator family transporter
MPSDDLSLWKHDHVFDQSNLLAERSTRLVMWITAIMMVVEIGAGWWFNSMALLADGWHMSSHAIAIGLSAFAYSAARRYARDPRFAFGTWKIEVLGGFASAILLLGVALLMVEGSVERILAPQAIQYREAIAIAVLGLLVNIVCAFILGKAHNHGHSHHGHDHHHAGHGHDHHDHTESKDLNLKSAYIHVIADAATSVLAIGALIGGWLLGWSWLDPVIGLLGAVVVAVWAKGLLVSTGKVLLDREMDHPVVQEIREVVELVEDAQLRTRITDLHVWRVGKSVYACAISVVTNDPGLTPNHIRERMAVHEEIVHATVEIHRYPNGAV